MIAISEKPYKNIQNYNYIIGSNEKPITKNHFFLHKSQLFFIPDLYKDKVQSTAIYNLQYNFRLNLCFLVYQLKRGEEREGRRERDRESYNN